MWHRLPGGMPLEAMAYIDWLCTPPNERECTLPEFSKKIGVNMNTLYRWKRLPVVREAWRRRAAELGVTDTMISNVIETLYQNAVAGDTAAATAFLRHVAPDATRAPRASAKPQETVTDPTPPAELSDQEIEARLAQMAEEMNQ